MGKINLLKPNHKKQPSRLAQASKTIGAPLWRVLRPLLLGAGVGLALVTVALLLLAVAYNIIYRAVDPDISQLLNVKTPKSTKIYSRDGQLLYEVYTIKRTPVPLSQIAGDLQHATIAIEDKDFYNHKGISLSALFRSAFADLSVGDAAYGGSTITQQLVKNTVLSPEKSFSRKTAEIVWAMEIENKLSKDQILELYLNQIPYGRNAYGIEAASQAYFGKSAKDLDLAESAYLAALPQAPSLYNPEGPNKDALEARKNYILQLMEEQGYISHQRREQAVAEQVSLQPLAGTFKAPHFVLWVRKQLVAEYGEQTVEEGGLKVYTTLDMRLQNIAEQAIAKYAPLNEKKYNAHNEALVAIDPKTGGILAMVGSKDYFGQSEPTGCVPGFNCLFEPDVNVATALRQPGSSFKPYVYVTAFGPQFSYGPSSIVLDETTNFSAPGAPPYIPHNYDNHSYGRVSMRKALAGSLNVSAVRTETLVGTDSVIKTARDAGITSPLKRCGLSLALGGCEVSLLDHVAGFSVFANGGRRNPRIGILKVEDQNGNILQSNDDPPNSQVVDPQAVYKLISIMTDNTARTFIFGAKSPLHFDDRTVAAKTGTTQNWHDGWTVGFTPSLAAGVWAGNNDGTLLKKGADGVFVAAPLWHEFMETALAGTPAEQFPIPPGITQAVYNPATGKPDLKRKSGPTEIFADYDLEPTKPKVAATAKPTDSLSVRSQNPSSRLISDHQGPTATITSPDTNSDIPKGPFIVTVTADWQPRGSVELYVDGQLIQTLTSPDFNFTVPSLFDVGPHIIVARAKSPEGLYGPKDTIFVNITPADDTELQFVPPDSTPP